MLTHAVESYLSLRHTCGFDLKSQGNLLRSFAVFSEARGKHLVCSQTAIAWAGLARSIHQRARRLSHVIRFARYVRTEDPSHEIPRAVFGSERYERSMPYIFSRLDIVRLLQAAADFGHPFRRQTYRTLFALLACTGLRVSEAIRLRLKDVTPDGMLIWNSKFRKSRLVPLHHTLNIAFPTLPSMTTCSCRYEESRCSSVMSRKCSGQPRTGSAYHGGLAPRRTLCVTPLRSGRWRPRLMVATASQSIRWRSPPISVTAAFFTPTGI